MQPGLTLGADGRMRCFWSGSDPLYQRYHDREWGRPIRNDVRLFEKLSLEGFQSGLSWLTILRKRENYRAAFSGFAIETVARFKTAALCRASKQRVVSFEAQHAHSKRTPCDAMIIAAMIKPIVVDTRAGDQHCSASVYSF